MLAAPPPVVVGGPRKGGTDAANAATWRLTPAPVGVASVGPALAKARGGGAGGEWFYVESLDHPGQVLTPAKKRRKAGDGGAVTLTLERVSGADAAQLWRKLAPSNNPGGGGGGGGAATWLLLNGGGAGDGVLSARRRTDGQANRGSEGKDGTHARAPTLH